MNSRAMQSYSAVFAKEKLTPHQSDIAIRKEKYALLSYEGVVIETGQKWQRSLFSSGGVPCAAHRSN
jgi:hypothetical protein